MTQSPTERAKGLLPYNKVVTRIATEAGKQAAVAALIASGFAESDIYVHHGEQGEKYLDVDGSERGFIGRLIRGYQRLQGVEKHLLDDAEDALKAGHYLIGAETDGSEEQQIAARDALVPHTDYNIYWCGKFTITILTIARRQ